ncbi:hypothetical protein HDU97_004637 [Phlyctochytrium planicorne]|nr:hypothetical protein HDU97_004637 [Phlyctochytrium planicorne]
MASLFGLGTSADIEVVLAGEDQRKQVEVKVDKEKKGKFPLYFDGESVGGKVLVRVKDGKKIEHQGIKIEFVGHIELFYDRGNHYEFASLAQALASPGELKQSATYDFEFKNVEKQYESYFGINVKLRYFIRVTIERRLSSIIKEKDLWVYSYRMPPEINNSIKMEVGIEDCLHIEFEYNKSKYHLRDVIVGKIYFLLVRIKIKHMELSIIRRETTGAAPNQYNESETITKFEIMDGAPVRGETIPIRLFLSGFELTPTYRDVNKKFSTRYYLNLVLIDEENRRYFKQQEITIYRVRDDSAEISEIPGGASSNGLSTFSREMKRGSEKQLTKDNFDQDNDAENATEGFQRGSEAELRTRVIAAPRTKKSSMASAPSTPSNSFTGFAFGTPNAAANANPTPATVGSTNPFGSGFSFTNNTTAPKPNEAAKENQPAFSFGLPSSFSSTPKHEAKVDAKKDRAVQLGAQLKGLNSSFSKHAQKLFNQDPFVNLGEIFLAYTDHRSKILKDFADVKDSLLKPSKPSTTDLPVPSFTLEPKADPPKLFSAPSFTSPPVPAPAPAAATAPTFNFNFGNNSASSTPSLFGSSSTAATPAAPPAAVSNFAPTPAPATTPAPAFSFSFGSQTSSFQTVPSMEKADTQDEDGGDDDVVHEEQVNPEVFMKGAGEETEDTLFEVKAKAFSMSSEAKKWVDVGVGITKVNVDRTTGKKRLILRADGSGRVLINFALTKGMMPKIEGKGLTFMYPQDGKLVRYLLRVKEVSSAEALTKHLAVE